MLTDGTRVDSVPNLEILTGQDSSQPQISAIWTHAKLPHTVSRRLPSWTTSPDTSNCPGNTVNADYRK